jgi:thioredoxin-like negative regulator of GroEL
MAKPIVDGLERDLAGQATVLRLDVMSQPGREAAAFYGVKGVPTLIVVDGQGTPVLTQVGLIRSEPVRQKIDQPAGNPQR